MLEATRNFCYNIDICLCVDKQCANKRVIQSIKEHFCEDIAQSFYRYGKNVGRIRVKTIFFDDSSQDKGRRLNISPFMIIPAQKDDFDSLLEDLTIDDNIEKSTNGLEALACAIQSDWCIDGWKRRHVIIMVTDADTYDLHHYDGSESLDNNPQSFEKLSAMWGNEDIPGLMEFKSKRLVLFTPNSSFWEKIWKSWECVALYPSKNGIDREDLQYYVLMDVITSNI